MEMAMTSETLDPETNSSVDGKQPEDELLGANITFFSFPVLSFSLQFYGFTF